MPKQREMFDRTDVPRDSPYRNVIGIAVCVIVLVAAAVIGTNVWERVQLEAHLGDSDLADALDAQEVTLITGQDAILLLTADSLDATGTTLSQARILVVNKDQDTAVQSEVALDLQLTVGDETKTLSDLYTEQGCAGVIAPLSAASALGFDHVIVATEDVLAEVEALAGMSAHDLMWSNEAFLAKVRTDLTADELLELAQHLADATAAAAAAAAADPASAATPEGAEG